MSFEIKASDDGRLMIVRHAGCVDCLEISEAALAVDRLIDVNTPPNLLVDFRAADYLPDLIEIEASRRKRQRQSPLVKKLAYVTNPVHSNTLESMALGHINRGISVRVFFGEFEAMEWLLLEQLS